MLLALGPGPAALAQGGSLLSPPSLPSTLPGGGALPNLPPGAQQEILQRILDAAGGRLSGGAPLASPGLPGPGTTSSIPVPVVGAGPLGAFGAQAVPPAAPDIPLAPAEAFFASRQAPGTPPLRLFGYEALQAAPGTAPVGLSFGAVPEDYVIGRDDELVLAFRGRARQTISLRVTRDGTLLVPDLPPIPAAGRTLRELRADLEARAQRDLGGSEVFVSVGQLRQLGVFVGGEVTRPGLQALTSLASVLDALVAAGGVKRSGSLRAVRVEGPRGRRTLDLYPVLAGEGTPPDLLLHEGDRILVPALGGVVAMGGEVSRPGIFELPAGAAQATLASLLTLAGQPMRPTGSRFLLQTTEADGRRAYREISPASMVRRGDLLLVQPGADVVANQLRLAGHVAVPVTRAAGGRLGLRGLLADARLVRPDPYARLAVIWRVDPQSRGRRYIAFDLGRVLAGRADQPLAEGDEVIILGQRDVQWLASPTVQQAMRGDAPGPTNPQPQLSGAQAAQVLANVALGQPAAAGPILQGLVPGAVVGPSPGPGQATQSTSPGALPGQVPANGPDCQALTLLTVAAQASPLRYAHIRGAGFPDIGIQTCPQVFLDYPSLLPYLLDQSTVLLGEVRLPGLYPVPDDTGLDAVLAAAGGVTDTADLSTVEFAREPADQAAAQPLQRLQLDLRSRNFAAVRLSPRDTVRFPRGFGDRELGPVTLTGEFVRPGIYDIRRGERLSEVIARAGGLTPQAYPYGAVFTRDSVQQRQQEGFRRSAAQLEQGLVQVGAGQALAGLSGPLDLGGAINAGRGLAATLRNTRAAGRMVVEANPVVLAGRPELDVLLEPNDLIAMPKRPNDVTVVGAVQNPGSLQFTSGWRAGDYLRAAGGAQRFADITRGFVVLPNGLAQPAGLGSWQSGGPPVPPGSLVVVPHDPSPFETWGIIRDLSGILSQVALSSAALGVIARSSR